jgi:hypothetical protein
MPFTMLRHDRSKFATAAGLLAAVALGGWLGNWVIGPAVSNDRVDRPPLPSAKHERAMIDAMSARPDPSPYRTPTPKFDVQDSLYDAARANEKAQASFARRMAEPAAAFDGAAEAREAFGYASDRAPRSLLYRKLDRHTGVVY